MKTTKYSNHLAPWLSVHRGDWEFSQVKYHFQIILGKMLQNLPQSSEDRKVPYLKAQHIQWDKVQVDDLPTMWASPYAIDNLSIAEGDLLVCEGGEVGRAAMVTHVPDDDCIIQNALHLVRSKPTGDLRFLKYVLRHATNQAWLDVLCNRATIAHFTSEKFNELWIWLPAVSTQTAIADYLDRKTAVIDDLLAEKQRLLAVLAEKRQALITQAVTRGLDGDAPLRDSGVDIWGTIPVHWTIVHLRRVLESMDYGISESVGIEGDVAILRMGDVYEGEISLRDVGFVSEVDSYLLLKPGDLLFNRTNSLAQVGKVGIFRGSPDYPVSFASYLVRMRCNETTLPDYLNYLLNSTPALIWARSEALPSIGQANLNPNRYSYLPIPLPPIEEQQAAIDFLQTETAKLDDLYRATEETIALLQERRAALIAAAVTGQIEVTE